MQEIQDKTIEKNVNNLTRTKAYLDFYLEHPDIHWALLAHMVSRNAGWNMTDLKGEWLPQLFSQREQKDYFQFLKRGNWLIFQDVYPQLLIFHYSLKQKKRFFTYLDLYRFLFLWKLCGNKSLFTVTLFHLPLLPL